MSDPIDGSGGADTVPGGGPGPDAVPEGPLGVELRTSDREGLFASSTIRMFGRVFEGLKVGELGVLPSANQQLAAHMRRNESLPEDKRQPLHLARIYGVVYQGEYYKLPDLPVMLVFGAGQPVPAGFRNNLTLAGFDYSTGTFVNDVNMWMVDALDTGVRIDVSIGWISEILLADAMGDDCDDPSEAGGMGGRAMQSKAASKMTSKAASKLASKLAQK